MVLVALDTNILLIPGTLGVNIFTQIEKACDFKPEFALLEGSIQELQNITKEQRGKYKSAAKLGLDLVKKKKVKILPSSGHVDDVLVEFSKEGVVVATQDAALKKRLHKPYLTLRAKKYFVLMR